MLPSSNSPDSSDPRKGPESQLDLSGLTPPAKPGFACGTEELAIGLSLTDLELWTEALLLHRADSQRTALAGVASSFGEIDPAGSLHVATGPAALPLLVGVGASDTVTMALELVRSHPEMANRYQAAFSVVANHPALDGERKEAVRKILGTVAPDVALQPHALSPFDKLEAVLVRQRRLNAATVLGFNQLFAQETIQSREFHPVEWARRAVCAGAICGSDALGAADTLSAVALAGLLETRRDGNRASGLRDALLYCAQHLKSRPAWLSSLLLICIHSNAPADLIGVIGRQEPKLRFFVMDELVRRVREESPAKAAEALNSLYWAVSSLGTVKRAAREAGMARFDTLNRESVFAGLANLFLSRSAEFGPRELTLMALTAVTASVSKVNSCLFLRQAISATEGVPPEVKRDLFGMLLLELPVLVDSGRFPKGCFTPMQKTFVEGMEFVSGVVGRKTNWFWSGEQRAWRQTIIVPALKQLAKIEEVEKRYLLPALNGADEERRHFACQYYKV